MVHVDVQRAIEQAKDAITVRRVYGDPFEKDGVTVIPAARVQNGGAVGEWLSGPSPIRSVRVAWPIEADGVERSSKGPRPFVDG